MNDLEKLITDLSNYWDLSPEKVVDRLNHMNESEIKNLVNKMTKKFEKGGLLPKAEFEDGGIIKCLKGGKTYAECKKCGGTVDKAESGVKLTKKQTKELAAKNKGITGSNFAISYQNAKNGLRQQGLRGNELRDRARIMVSGISPQSASLITPKPFVGPVATVNNTFVAERPELLGSKAEHEYEHLMRQRVNTEIAIENADKFGDAFNMARKAGMLTFK